MKVIDEKGRLFGKINAIDFLAILFLLCLMPMFYFGYKIFNRPVVVEKKEEDPFTFIETSAIFKNLNPEVAKLIAIGDREIDDSGNVIGEILEVGKVESNFIKIDLGEGRTITKEDHQRKQASVKIRLIGELDGNDILCKGNKLKIGSPISFKTDRYEIKGIIIPEPYAETEVSKAGFSLIKVDIVFKNLSPEIAKLISVGDFEADKSGDTIAKALSKGKPEPYSYKLDLGGGNYVTRTDPKKRQVLAKMEIMGRIEGNTFYFKDKRIALESTIEFNTNKYNVKGTIVKEPTPVRRSVKLPIKVDIVFKNLSPEIAKLISVGDFEADKSGDTIAKALSKGKPEPYSYKLDLGGGNYVTRTDPKKRQVLAKMEIMGRIEGNTFYFKDKRIALESIIEFNTNKYRIKGLIIKQPAQVKKIDREWVILKVKFTNLIPELTSCINEGDEERDISGALLAKVRSIVNNEPTETMVLLKEGEKVNIAKYPVNRDVILLIEGLCIKTQKGLFFKETRIKIGNGLVLRTDEYDIAGRIIGIEEIRDL